MNKMDGILIMRPFNGVFFGVFALFILVLILVSLWLKKKDIETRKKVLVCASLATLVFFVIYKYILSIDPDYNALREYMGGFNWWGELPLHLCNVNMIMIPIAVILDRRELLAFCFFVGPLGALMALSMPGPEFQNASILLPRMIGYYGTHFLIVIEGLAIVTFGLYRPRFKDIPRTVLTILLVSFAVFMINMIMRWTGIYDRANYFFSVETEGNFILEIFHKWLPYPFLYLLPCTIILAAYMAIINLGFLIGNKIKGNDKIEDRQ